MVIWAFISLKKVPAEVLSSFSPAEKVKTFRWFKMAE